VTRDYFESWISLVTKHEKQKLITVGGVGKGGTTKLSSSIQKVFETPSKISVV